MRNLLQKFLTAVFILFLASGCAFHTGMMNNSASLSENNFKLVKYAKGQASTTKIFGIGGLSKDGLVAEAKNNMYQNYPLRDGQTIANVTVDFKQTIFIVVIKTKVTVTADIVEFK